MTRFVDRGAIVAAWVGVGMAVTIGISFLLVIPIEPIYWLLTVPAGLLIGYYANQRSDRRGGPWGRVLANALLAGLATGLTLALLLLAIKGLFFYADNGYPKFNRTDPQTLRPVPPLCENGAGCVYARYLDDGRGPALVASGVTDAASFTSLYWGQQFATAGSLLVAATLAGLGGGVIYGLTNRSRPKARVAAEASGPG